ncbi:MAG TPA: alpha-aminoadipate/glutamate carrier protein LysW/ArgW [Nitrososphaerales archaeon]|nr:alpha-aminoadipate/glutamate carrier protein LysW/ArgW [Nitrososphaerales archaeon]
MEAKCLECDAKVKIEDDAVIGEIVSCPDCGADYEVASLENGTVTVKSAESVKEDWGE